MRERDDQIIGLFCWIASAVCGVIGVGLMLSGSDVVGIALYVIALALAGYFWIWTSAL